MAAKQMTHRAAQDNMRLARELRGLRHRAGLGAVETAKRAGMSQAKISRIENYRTRPSVDDVRTLCSVYGAEPPERDELLQLAESVQEESRRARVVLSRNAAKLQGYWQRMDAKSALRRTYSPTMVCGILQTPDYIRVLFEGAIAPDAIEETVRARLERRKTLGKDAKQQHVLIMSEGALRWQIGSPELMVEQLDVIAEVSLLPNVRVGIIPWTRPARFAITHAFDLYDDEAVIVGTEVMAIPYTKTPDIQVYLETFGRLESLALFGDDARRELLRIGNDYRLLS